MEKNDRRTNWVVVVVGGAPFDPRTAALHGQKKGREKKEGREKKGEKKEKKREKKSEKKEKKKMDENQPVPDILLVLRNHILGLVQEKPVRSNPTT